MPRKSTKTNQDAPALTEQEIVSAATNVPLKADEFTLGNRTFTMRNLPYKDYLLFVGYLQPLFDSLLNGMTSHASALAEGKESKFGLPKLSVNGIFKYCEAQLPEMACIVCKQSDPSITTEQVMELAKDPFDLFEVVLKQVKYNQIIERFSDFFGQLLPLMGQVKSNL